MIPYGAYAHMVVFRVALGRCRMRLLVARRARHHTARGAHDAAGGLYAVVG
jgi:hypothetical protein